MKKKFVLLSIMLITFPVSASTLKQGDSSNQVMKLQQALIDGGYFSGTADGHFDSMTEEAVRKYQEEAGVTADGVVNDIQYLNLTFEAIDNLGKSASDYDFVDWDQFANSYEKAQVRDSQNDNYYVQDYIGKRLSDFCFINNNRVCGSDYSGEVVFELANFGEKYADVLIESDDDLYNYTVVYQDPMPDSSVSLGSSDKLTVRLGVIFIKHLSATSSPEVIKDTVASEIATLQPEEKKSFVIVDGDVGEYGESVTLNKGTEFEETEIIYHIPVGTYSITNTDKKVATQVSIYSSGPELVGGWEEFVADANCQRPLIVFAGETKDIEIKEGQFIVLADDSGDLRFDLK